MAKGNPRKLHLTICTDGGSKGNPGPSAAAAVIKDDDGDVLLDGARFLGNTTNNVAEYRGLILGLELAAELKPTAVTIKSDSQLLVRQMAGQYKVKSPALKPLIVQVQRMLGEFESVEIAHVPRGQNTEADLLVQKAIAKALEKGKSQEQTGSGET
ncbi:MAG: ribonuclease HI family protein, partial [Phycisphaerae bacterium]|nr:ribonuclease HI family protein [Phycisphaerae bacterium]